MSDGGGLTIAAAGHWLLAADRIGPMVLQRIEGRYGPDVELCDLGTGGLALLDQLRGQELLIVVDACRMGGVPGALSSLSLDRAAELPASVGATSVHQVGPLEALHVARHLTPDQLPRRTLLVLVETEGLDEPGEARAADLVVATLDGEVARWRDGRR
jgi:hydrogenase maturation protease